MCINLPNGVSTVNEVPTKKEKCFKGKYCAILTMVQGTVLFMICTTTLLKYQNLNVFRNMSKDHHT